MSEETGPKATFEKHLSEGRFMIQRSASTGEHVFFPKIAAPSGATDLEWVEVSGGGTVYAITLNRGRSGKRNVALIDLDEGARMMSTLPNVETAEIGTRVRARIEDWEGGHRVVFDICGKEAR